jgi:aryl-alcohol dehydrogenase-like predicted oxidoreductase
MPNDIVIFSGRPVHRVGFGAMQLPGPGVFGPPADRDRALQVLRQAVEAGVDHIDTAQFYGPDVANELIHEALHPYPETLVLVSKVGARRDDQGQWGAAQLPEELRAGVEDNLRSLELEQVPVVNLRRHPESVVPLEDQLAEMHAMREQGLIGAVGVSNVTADEYRQARQAGDLACVQNSYNLLDRADQEVFDLCAADGVPYVPFFPLGSAFMPQMSVLLEPAVVEVAERLGLTPAQVALAWLLDQAPSLLLIPGTSSPDHLAENLAVAEVVLDAEALAALADTARESTEDGGA